MSTLPDDIGEVMRKQAEKPITDEEVFGLLDCYSSAFIKLRVKNDELASALASWVYPEIYETREATKDRYEVGRELLARIGYRR